MKAPADTYAIVNEILRRGNRAGLIADWWEAMRKWAEANSGPDAAALRSWTAIVRPRPFYTAAELARLWPALKLTLGLATRLEPAPSPGRLENELYYCRLPVLQADDGRNWFLYQGTAQKFYIVEYCHYWRQQKLSQETFEKVMYGKE